MEAFLVNDLTVTPLLVLGVAESDLLRIPRRRLKQTFLCFILTMSFDAVNIYENSKLCQCLGFFFFFFFKEP